MNIITGADANTTLVPGSLHIVDMSGWATADRSYSLPASPAPNDRVGVLVHTGSASFALILKTAAGVEITRLFITDESFVWRFAGGRWIVEHDGRIAQKGNLRLTTNATGEAAGTYTVPTTAGGAWVADTNVGSVCATGTGTITGRRANPYRLALAARGTVSLNDQNYFGADLLVGGATSTIPMLVYASGATLPPLGSFSDAIAYAAGTTFQFRFRSQQGARGCLASNSTYFSVVEVLP